MKKVVLMMLTLLLSVSTGLAQKNRVTLDLAPTASGQEVHCQAQASKGWIPNRRGTVEAFAITVYADMGFPDINDDPEVEKPEFLQVLIDTTSGQTNLPIGEVKVLNGYGSLILMNRMAFGSDRPGDLSVPLSEIKTVKLVHRSDNTTEGSFNTKPYVNQRLTGVLQSNIIAEGSF